MGYPSWQSSRAHSLEYCARRSTESALYRLVYLYHEELERGWDEFFRERYGFLREEVKNAFLKYLDWQAFDPDSVLM